MSLYDKMLNIKNIDKESLIKEVIAKTLKELNNLDYERMCLVYSSYLYKNLKQEACLAYIIDTTDLGFDFKHRFVLVPNNDTSYLLDLTYKQFNHREESLMKLYNDGYQEVNEETYNQYLNSIIKNKNNDITMDNSIFKEGKRTSK